MKTKKELEVILANIIQEQADHFDDWREGVESVIRAMNGILNPNIHLVDVEFFEKAMRDAKARVI